MIVVRTATHITWSESAPDSRRLKIPTAMRSSAVGMPLDSDLYTDTYGPPTRVTILLLVGDHSEYSDDQGQDSPATAPKP